MTPGEKATDTKEVICKKKFRLDDLQGSMGRCGGNRMAQLSGDARSQTSFVREKFLVLTEEYSPQAHGINEGRDGATWVSWRERYGMPQAGGVKKEMRCWSILKKYIETIVGGNDSAREDVGH